MADTDDRGTAFLKAEAGIGDEIRIAVAANGYQPQEKIAQMNADTVGGAGGILSIGGGAQFMLERIPASAIYLTVEVRDANTNKGLYAAEVRVRSKSTGAEVYAALTNEDGGTDKLEIPVEKAAQGLQVRVKANNYEEKWSDIAPELVTIGERRYSVFLSPACRLAGTWAFNVPALGSSTFVIDSKGTTRESGMGSSTGTTVLSGRTLTYTWTTVYGYDGNVVIDLNESCTEGRGKVTWTKYPPTEKRGSTFPATLTRRN
jgi:hypothetical protein